MKNRRSKDPVFSRSGRPFQQESATGLRATASSLEALARIMENPATSKRMLMLAERYMKRADDLDIGGSEVN